MKANFILFVFVIVFSVKSHSATCSGSGYAEGGVNGPDYVVLNESNEFNVWDYLDVYGSDAEFATSEDGYIGTTEYNSVRGLKVYAEKNITFSSNSSLGKSWVMIDREMDDIACKTVNVQRFKPYVNEIEILNLRNAGGALVGRISVDGHIDNQYSARAGSPPLHTIEIKCNNWSSWQAVRVNSVNDSYDFSMQCDFSVRAKVFDGTYTSSVKGKAVKYSDIVSNETGPNSSACLAVCPRYLEPYRSACMQSNSVCH